MKTGQLFVVATPIGNWADISQRAMNVLQSCHIIVCEQRRMGSTLLKKIDIHNQNLLELNEHNEKEQTPDILNALFNGQDVALTSDCGTPAFADPGALLISQAMQFGIKVIPVPGPSSLMAAISVSPLPLKEFFFAGFLPRNRGQCISQLKQLRGLRKPLIVMDTPYRMQRLLTDVAQVFGKKQLVTLAFNLTLPDERIIHGILQNIQTELVGRKGEFILIIHY